ncbi:RNA polymerase sigma factor [Niabella drilacis]|uniref:RNA polymerase sigma-70 factor, ECF subfamily n=1 Tax=Niabella drilacis (strain DSM 25811 / CCM 8410 / CCUG 62505 / LMG 26954 / E90) TaxID=1285928 RepID=A0A1G6R110_NIADE|nr:RNA polymerase sigma-70 factor [Niabella drilacis]SDC98191.1 RNA polymerase sigma-70 factor, ECF subfamily [Niabella drilacis]
MEVTTGVLLGRIVSGDERAFRQLYNRYHQQIYAIGYYLSRSQTIAEDIVQDVFLKIWDKRAELREVRQFEGWLKIIVKNHTLNVLEKAAKERLTRKVQQEQERAALAETLLAPKLEQKEINHLIQKAIDRLPPQQKKAYLLSRQEGFKVAEIAEIMDLSIYTVKNHLKVATASIIAFCKRNMELVITMVLLSKK